MADRTSPLASQPSIADEQVANKGRRKVVRMFSNDSSSSDEGAAPEALSKAPDDHAPGHLRSSSFPGTGTSSSTSPASRLPTLTASQPKVQRSATYGRGASSSTATAPPPMVGGSNYTNWRNKYRTESAPRPGGHRTSVRRPRGLTRGEADRMDRPDPDADYARAMAEWASDDDDDDDLDGHAHARPVKALVAEAVRRATTGDEPVGPSDSLTHIGVGHPKSLILPIPPPDAAGPDTAEGKERLEWQNMLASVLGGDILRGESYRIGVELPNHHSFRKTIAENLWWQIRARLRSRTEDEEKRRVEQRRNRVVDPVLEEIATFSVKHDSEISAIDQVAFILQKLEVIEGLYPHQHAFRADKPLYDSEAFRSRVDALSAWYSVVTQLQSQLHILQKWTGTEDLDITRPNTTKEKALVGKNRFHPLDPKARAHAQQLNDAADDSTFVDRVLKEDSLSRTFERRIFMDQLATIQNAKETVIAHSPLFAELHLPEFLYELLRIISFPGRLIIEALKTRLRAAERLTNPDLIIIDDIADSFRNSVSLAIIIRKQYEEIVAPDPENRWNVPDSFPSNYREVILKCIKMHFKLLHWKLKSNSKAVYFRDTEVMEAEWEFLYDASESIEGVDIVVAETLCSLANKLMVRVSAYFENSLHLPISIDEVEADDARNGEGRQFERQPMTTDNMINWYSKILDSIKMRYRKLQRFARRLTQRFENSAEYIIEDEDTDALIESLHESGHFLVYTNVFEEQGTYIFADGSLWDRPGDVHQLLFRAFAVNLSSSHGRGRGNTLPDPHSEDEDEYEDDMAQYLLLVSPRQSFAWTGAVMTLDVGESKAVDFALEDSRIRLIADGVMSRLTYCKLVFQRSFLDPETQDPTIHLRCIIEAQAHLPKVNRELKKIARSGLRLSENIIESATHVRRNLRGASGTQDLIENYYLFASDHGHRVAIHMDHVQFARFSRLLMRLAISWVSFICDNCDPTDRKTFRWTVNALEYAMLMTRGTNILHLNKQEFALLRAKVANCMTLLISHFDILGARSSIEAKKEAERLETIRRMAQLYEQDVENDWLLPRTPSPAAQSKMVQALDRSLRMCREDRLQLIQAVEEQLGGLRTDQHLMGRVLDEEVSEDRALVFLAASSSNISLRWQQGGFIGGGANGSVYLGFNLDSGGIMAVKEIRIQDVTNSPSLYKAIKDEADVMQMLSHPNIVDYYGIEVHRDRVYIFEEYCPGGSLADLLVHGRVEDEDVTMVYAWQMLQGLQYLHSKGVEHRDVKPDNILLGANSVLKYVDFGAAKVITKVNRTMAKTRAISRGGTNEAGAAVMNSLAGTPMYLAPEVIKGKSGRLGASDIWSMGCVVLEVCTGRKPWSNLDNEWAIMFHIGIATQHPPLPEPGQLSDLGIDFIEQCLTLDPHQRPTAAELLAHPWLAPLMDISLPDVSPTTSSLPSVLTAASLDAQDDLVSFASTPTSQVTPPASIAGLPEEYAKLAAHLSEVSVSGIPGPSKLSESTVAGCPHPSVMSPQPVSADDTLPDMDEEEGEVGADAGA